MRPARMFALFGVLLASETVFDEAVVDSMRAVPYVIPHRRSTPNGLNYEIP